MMLAMITIKLLSDVNGDDYGDEDDTNGNAATDGNDDNDASDKHDIDDTHGNDRSFYQQQHSLVPFNHGQRLPNRLLHIIR